MNNIYHSVNNTYRTARWLVIFFLFACALAVALTILNYFRSEKTGAVPETAPEAFIKVGNISLENEPEAYAADELLIETIEEPVDLSDKEPSGVVKFIRDYEAFKHEVLWDLYSITPLQCALIMEYIQNQNWYGMTREQAHGLLRQFALSSGLMSEDQVDGYLRFINNTNEMREGMQVLENELEQARRAKTAYAITMGYKIYGYNEEQLDLIYWALMENHDINEEGIEKLLSDSAQKTERTK